MPKVIKYSTSTPSGSLRKGNMVVGPGNYDYGTTFYNTVEPPAGGYTIYQNKASGGPSIYVATNDASLISFTKHISGTTYATAAACLNYFATQTDKIVIASSDKIPVSVTSGSVLNLNAGMVSSYPTSGSTWYDVSGGNNLGTLTNNPTFNSGDKTIVFDGVDDYADSGYDLSWNNTNSISISFWMNPSTISGGNYGIIGKMYPDWEWAFYQNNSSLNLVYWNTGGGHTNGMDFGVNAFPTANIWYYVVYTWNGSTSTFYINGTIAGSKIADNPSINQNRANNVMIGGHTYVWTDAYWNGKISNVNFYNRVLTQSEILQNYYQAPIVTNGLILALDASNRNSYPGSGTTWYDLSGNGAHGTLINGTGFSNEKGGVLTFDGIDDGVDGINIPQNYVDLMIGMYSEGGNGTGLEMVFAKYNDADKSFRTAEGVLRHSILDSNDWNYNNTQYDYANGSLITENVNLVNSWNIVRLVNQNSTFTPPFVYSISSDFYNRRYKGKIAFVLCYNRVLSTAEVNQNYNALRSRFGL